MRRDNNQTLRLHDWSVYITRPFNGNPKGKKNRHRPISHDLRLPPELTLHKFAESKA